MLASAKAVNARVAFFAARAIAHLGESPQALYHRKDMLDRARTRDLLRFLAR